MTQNATDFENQVINLVKAAMSGDEEANDVIVQIIEAAKKGDEQALKVVALIKQLTQSTSDQAEEGAEENTEVMKCGGKVRAKMKAKKSAEKKEEGGEIPEEKCGGTAKKMRKAVCKAKKCEKGDKLTDTQKFLLGAKCGCKVKKTKKCEEGDTLDNWEDTLSVKCGGKAKKHQYGGTATYYVGPNGDMEQATPEEKIIRMRKYGAPSTRNISYNYVPGEIHVVSGLDSAPVYVNTNTGKYIKNDKGVYLPVVEKESGMPSYGSYQRTTPDQDIYRFPDGTVERRKGKQQDYPDIPRVSVDYPVLPNDNTSTIGSALQGDHGNIRGGVYITPTEPIQVPEDYTPEEWEEIHDNVNGQVRVTWRNPRTGEIVTIKPKGVIIPAKANGGYLDFSKIAFNKCGGKAKKVKKVKKGENGVQLPKGAHGQTWSRSTSSTTVFSKGGKQCPCALKRIGGKIVNVDTCTGLPVHKQGGSIKKYQDPAGAITYNPFFGDKFMYDPDKRQFYIFGRNGEWQEIAWDQLKDKRGSQEFLDKLYATNNLNPTEGLYIDKDEDTGKVVWSKTGRFPYIYSNGWITPDGLRMHYNNGTYIINPDKDNEETLTFSEYYDRYPNNTRWLAQYNDVEYRGEEIPYKDGKAQWDPAQQKYVYKIYRTVSAPATEAGDSPEGSATAATASSSTTAQQGASSSATTAATSTSSGASSQSGSKQNFAEWIKQNAPQYQSYQERKKLAEKYGIQDYNGSLQQNLQMWDRMKNDSTLNSQSSSEEGVPRKAPVTPLHVPIIPASKKVEFPTISSADIRSNSVSTPLTLKTEPIKLPTIRLANRKTPQSASLLNEGTEYETPQRTYQQRLSQIEY